LEEEKVLDEVHETVENGNSEVNEEMRTMKILST